MTLPCHLHPKRLRFLTTRALGLLASLALSWPAAAENVSELEIDQIYKVTAQGVRMDGGYVQMTLPLGGPRLMRVPAERVHCLTNCPPELIELAQLTSAGSMPANARGFQIHGSNTIGAELMPDLIEDYLTRRQAKRVTRGGLDTTSDPKVPRLEITFENEQGASEKIEIFSGGSGTGFEKLRTKATPIWMSSRPANQKEVQEFSDLKLGNLLDPESEHVIALDGLAIIVHPKNPVGVLSLDQIARIFAGEIKDWSEVDGPSGKIKVFRRSDESGTNSTFKDLIMTPAKKDFGSEVKPIVKNEDLKTEVLREEAAIAFIGIGFADTLKQLAIRTKCGMAYKPDPFSIKTEEYPLSRRLFLYTSAKTNSALADELLGYALSSDGQQIVRKSGFVELELGSPEKFEAQAGRIANMLAVGASDLASTKRFLDAVRFAERLPLTIRFKPDSAQIDNKGEHDLRILADALNTEEYRQRQLLLIGFSDDQSPETALDVSKERALTVARALQKRLNEASRKPKPITIYDQNVKWFGSAGPIACNADDKGAPDERGRALNRRVEVWIR